MDKFAREALYGLVCVACAIITARVHASDLRPGIIGSRDDRIVIDRQSEPWTAIGQVNVSGYRHVTRCTGSLIASNVVITAAHCVMDPWTRQPFPLHQIHFVAGINRSGWLGHSTAKCLHFPPGYEYVGPSKILPSIPFQAVPQRALMRDAVLIVLRDELDSLPTLPTDHAQVQGSDIALVHASYPADRRHVLSGHFGCHLLAKEENLWFTDCDTHAASSGGPIFIQGNDNLKLAAIMVGIADKSYSIAVPIANWVDVAAKGKCP